MNLREQISSKCIFFTGVQHSKCACGIPYEDVRVGKPYRFPCLNKDESCDKRKFLTKEEVDIELQELEDFGQKSISALSKVRRHFNSTREREGQLKCDCGGDLSFIVSFGNNHISAFCKKCKISVRE